MWNKLTVTVSACFPESAAGQDTRAACVHRLQSLLLILHQFLYVNSFSGAEVTCVRHEEHQALTFKLDSIKLYFFDMGIHHVTLASL